MKAQSQPKPQSKNRSKIGFKSKNTKAPSKLTASDARAVRLCLQSAEARSVGIAGGFNDWQPEPLQRDSSGGWSIELILPPGDYEYLFVVDDCWLTDPECAEECANPFGGKNSVLRVPSIGRKASSKS